MKKGFTLIEMMIVVAIIAIIAAIAIPSLLAATKTSNETAAVGTLRTYAASEVMYKKINHTYGTLAQLGAGNLLAADVVAAIGAGGTPKQGYLFFDLAVVDPNTEFAAGASPSSATAGSRSFVVETDATVYGGPAVVGAAPAKGAGWTVAD